MALSSTELNHCGSTKFGGLQGSHIGVYDIGGTWIKFGIVNGASGELIAVGDFVPSPSGPDEKVFLDALETSFAFFAEYKLAAIGLAAPPLPHIRDSEASAGFSPLPYGVYHPDMLNGENIFFRAGPAVNLQVFRDRSVDLRSYVENKTGVRTYALKDTVANGLAHIQFERVLNGGYVIVGTGTGYGTIIDGKVGLRETIMLTQPDGSLLSPSLTKVGLYKQTVQELTAGAGFVKQFGHIAPGDNEQLGRAAAFVSKLQAELLHLYGERLPKLIVYSGGVASLLGERLTAGVQENLHRLGHVDVEVRLTALNNAGLHGAGVAARLGLDLSPPQNLPTQSLAVLLSVGNPAF